MSADRLIAIGLLIAAVLFAFYLFLDWLLSDPMREPTPDDLAHGDWPHVPVFESPFHSTRLK